MFCLAIKDLVGRRYPLAKTYVHQSLDVFIRELYDFSHLKATYRVCDDWVEATPYTFTTKAEAQIYLSRDYGISDDLITEEYVEGL